MILEVIKISSAIILGTIAFTIVLFLFYFVWYLIDGFTQGFKQAYQLALKEANVSTFKELIEWRKKKIKEKLKYKS